MIKPNISVTDSEAKIFYQDENFNKIEINDERCSKIIVENLSFDISNDSYIIKKITKIKKNKILRLDRIMREFYDKDLIAKSNISLLNDSVTRILKHNTTADTPITKETVVLFSGNGQLFAKYIYDETKTYRVYIDNDMLIITNYVYQTGLDDYQLTFERIIGKMNFDDIDEFIDVFNIE